MTAEIGLFSLCLSGVFALFTVLLPVIGIYRNNDSFRNSAPNFVYAQFFFVVVAYISLTICFIQNDFTVYYVLANSSIKLPFFYKLCAVWGGHEGSMLLWVAILSFWSILVSFYSQNLDKYMRTRVLVVLGFVSLGFILFILFTSNPFLRQFNILNTDGRDLNPLLQDPGFLFHPPMLYMGYVGFAVPFAFAIASLWESRVLKTWVKFAIPWTLAAWCFLTLGITLGSWWAYRELGWGGWWFWDPVENASFMPWITGTALIHALIVCEKNQMFKAWTVILAISAFSLSLIGTFLVRSGVLTSVHAFAVDPARGLYILLFLFVIIGGSLLLFSFRADSLESKKALLISKESAMISGSVLLFIIMLTILLGTLYPLIIDGLGLGKLSVGAPYFNAVFVPFFLLLMVLMGIGVHLKWGSGSLFLNRNVISVLISVIVIFLLCLKFSYLKELSLYALLGLTLTFWLIGSTIIAAFREIKLRGINLQRLTFWSMCIAHLGIGFTALGVTISTSLGHQYDYILKKGDSIKIAHEKVSFIDENELSGPNYHGAQVIFAVLKNDKSTKIVKPEKRIYDATKMPMTDSAIDVSIKRDLYIALGEPVGEDAWSVRIYYKPLVRFIWGGGILMFLGGIVAILARKNSMSIAKPYKETVSCT